MHENTLLTKLLIISLVATVIVGVAQLYYGFSNSVTSSKTVVDNSEKNEIKKVEEQNIPDDFFVKSFVKRIEQNNNLSREDKDKLIESYLYNANIKADLKNTGYLNDIGNNKVKASFEIDKDGYISNYRILESSNNENVDKKVLKAIKNLNPYKPLPAIFNGESKYVEFAYSNDGFSGFTTYPANNPRALEELNVKVVRMPKKDVNMVNGRFVNSEVKVYSKERGEYIPLSEQKSIVQKEQIARLAEERYKEYIKNCILEKFGNSYKTSHTKAQIFFRVNKDGYADRYSIFSVSDSDTRKYYDEDSKIIKDKLEKAFIAASPFQPFPSNINKDYIVMGIGLGCNKVTKIVYGNNYEPAWEHKINQVGKKRNPKKVEDTKLLSSYVNLQGRNSLGYVNYSKWIPIESINLNWEPPLTENSHVVIICPLVKGKLGVPTFEKKSEFEAANRAALEAIKKALVPDSSGMEKYENVTVSYNFEVK